MKVLALLSFFSWPFWRPPRRRTRTRPTARGDVAARTASSEALEHNFDVQIQRYNPEISLYDLNAAYGGYDPDFQFFRHA